MCILEVDRRKEEFLQDLEREKVKEEEERSGVRILTVAEQIREKLRNSEVVQEINDCFERTEE